jgi:uncharacterized protein YraI
MILRTLTAAAILATAIAAVPGPASATDGTVGQQAKVVNVPARSHLNVRAKPALHGRKVGTIPAHGRPFVHRCVPGYDGRWCKVTFGDCTGWASARFLAIW